MKSLEELRALKEQKKIELNLRHSAEVRKITVGMGTCGIAAGARNVLNTIMDEIGKLQLTDVIVSIRDCAGNCGEEPVVEVTDKDGGKVTYVKMTPEKAVKVVNEHLVNGTVVSAYTSSAEK